MNVIGLIPARGGSKGVLRKNIRLLNNKPLIKNPNKIYAGFTIYTPIIEGREVATE